MRVFYARIAGATVALSLESAARPVSEDNYHLTLAFVGEVAPARLAVLQQIGRDLSVRSFTIKIDADEYWPGSHVVVAAATEVPVELTELSRRLRNLGGTPARSQAAASACHAREEGCASPCAASDVVV